MAYQVIGDSPLGGMKITFGYAEHENTIANNQTLAGGTVAITMPVGPLSVGFQRKLTKCTSRHFILQR